MLKVNDRIKLNDGIYIVKMINDTRAYCIPERKKHIEYTMANEKKVAFDTIERGISISPNSEIEVLNG